ncbi:helix-turn-helix transcriptional regulator [Lutibacter sp. HS1-25]|uniref:helix-turn-helix transcriptional regulator n=1 Tax=Lutibacter sp. HS1-25 TaxID=2485000 RepID=UPI001F0BA441|nr:helix-turn-helix transcriptional regulator [Lutibacter sp. HS1-25]
MDYYEISAAQLAEKVDVQRSSISHLLSGRNKPSLDFVLKILKAFPDVELYWLLNGVGSFPKNLSNITNISTPTIKEIVKENTSTTDQVKSVTKATEATVKTDLGNSSENLSEIDRIVIFFKDGTFKNYIP